MADKPNYLREAARLPAHKLCVVLGIVATVLGLTRACHGNVCLWPGSLWPLGLFVVAEVIFLVVLPALPGFRAYIDRLKAEEEAHRRAVDLERIATRLSPTAKSRLDGVMRLRGRILDSLKTMSAPDSMQREWQVKLAELTSASLRILVAVDNTRIDDRDTRLLDSEIKELTAELAGLADGPAKSAKVQRLEVLRKRAGGSGVVKEQPEAAVTQFEIIEDLLKTLLDQALVGRDSAAFGGRLQSLQTQIEAAGETVAALDRGAETAAELAALKAAK